MSALAVAGRGLTETSFHGSELVYNFYRGLSKGLSGSLSILVEPSLYPLE